MPVQDCVGSRDSITESLGVVLANHFDYTDDEHVVTSYCRVTDGTWIAWRNLIQGDTTDPSTSPDTNKTDWSANIASATAISVGFFPDDETIPVVYNLGVDPFYDWEIASVPASRDPCSRYPFIGDRYSDTGRGELTGWGMAVLDVQVRTDGSNVWVTALARESVKYPFLYNAPTEIDNCGDTHPTFEDYWDSGHDDAFFHDIAAGNRWWIYEDGSSGGDKPFGDYDDPGLQQSFRWQPARVTVFAGDIGGFTLIGQIDAKFANDDTTAGLCGGIESCASPTEPGVMHLLWAEGGWFGTQTVTADQKLGERINYSQWGFTRNLLDTDLRYVEQAGPRSDGWVDADVRVWTGEYVLRNDHGAPIAVVWPPDTDGVNRFASAAAEFWDLSDGTLNVLQTADVSLAPTAAEGNSGDTPESVFAQVESSTIGVTRSQFASSLYTDPTLENTDVYLFCVGYGQGDQVPGAQAFLRIPCVGSATFDYMDGTRLSQYSIIPGVQFLNSFGFPYFQADFVSDTKNVWMPTVTAFGGAILHLTRMCERTWEILAAFPTTGTGFETGTWGVSASTTVAAPTSPPTLLTDESDDDWIAGGGTVVTSSPFPTEVAAIKARICRCCVPCVERTGLHVWQVL